MRKNEDVALTICNECEATQGPRALQKLAPQAPAEPAEFFFIVVRSEPSSACRVLGAEPDKLC